MILHVLGEHLSIWNKNKEVAIVARWQSPMLCQHKVNFDVAIWDDFAVGVAVIKNHVGKVVGTSFRKFHVEDSEDGEIRAT